MRLIRIALAVLLVLLFSASLAAQETGLRIVASHSIAADVLARVAGADAEVTSLIPRGSDPHSYRPAPSDLRALADADLVFINGAGYEEGLLAAIELTVAEDALFTLSDCVAVLPSGHEHEHEDDDHGDEDDHADADHGDEDEHVDDDHGDEDEHENDDHGDEDEHEDDDHGDEGEHVDDDHGDEGEHEDDDHGDEDEHVDEVHEGEEDAHHEAMESLCEQHEVELGERFLTLPGQAGPGPLYSVNCSALQGCDPHVWLLPRNVALWTLLARDVLAARDSANATAYGARSDAFLDDIVALEQELLLLVAALPQEQRVLISNHLTLGYFAAGFGFETPGSVLPGTSTLAEPGVAQLAALIDLVREHNLPVIFGEATSSNDVAQQVAAESGAQLVLLQLESLGEAEGLAGTWLEMLRNLVTSIVASLEREDTA